MSPVDHFQANDFGLHDMFGNAWQWTADCYHDSYKGAPIDGSAWVSGDCSRRVLRGGSWLSRPRDLRTALRYGIAAGNQLSSFGFRVARTLITP